MGTTGLGMVGVYPISDKDNSSQHKDNSSRLKDQNNASHLSSIKSDNPLV